MGNDAKFFCVNCKAKESLGRAYNYNPEYINKKALPKDLFVKLTIAKERFKESLKSSGLYVVKTLADDAGEWILEDELAFLENHKDHEVWLLDDYYSEPEEEKK